MADASPALRKRQQIENASRTMFLWVAIAAVVVGMTLVVSVSLFQTMKFRQKVLNQKNTTVSTLRHNNEIADSLKEKVRVLNTNQALLETQHADESEPLAVVLDALPSNPNSSAFGASLQQRLLDVDGVTVESVSVPAIQGVEDSEDTAAVPSAELGEIEFKFVVTSRNVNNLQKVLSNIEHSIRPIDILSLTVEQQNNNVVLSVEGKAYYKSAKKVELREEPVKP